MITIISKPACPYCDQAKALLKSRDIPYLTVNVDVGQPRVEGEEYITREEVLARNPTLRTVPYITDGEIKIGGYLELRRYLDQLELKTA